MKTTMRLVVICMLLCPISLGQLKDSSYAASNLTTESAQLNLVYQWLYQQQDVSTGLLPSQQDNVASTYNNALAVMVFSLQSDYTKAQRILDYYESKASEFFNDRCGSFSSPCASSDPCGASAPCGFFQSRDSKTGEPHRSGNRWMGDNAWLLLAIHHYQARSNDTGLAPMAAAIVRMLKAFQQLGGYVASGWEMGDSRFNSIGHAEGNLDAYKALLLFGEAEVAQQIKHWLDYTDLDWQRGPLDLHSWRVLSLGKGYGFSLLDTERTDDETIRYKTTITYKGTRVTGFLDRPIARFDASCTMNNNIWSEGTGQMSVSFYKAGYKIRGNFYAQELGKLLFEPEAFPGTRTIAFLAHSVPQECTEYNWVDANEGHVASASWYVFAKERFDPFDGVVISSFDVQQPIAKIEGENYDAKSLLGVRHDNTGEVSEGDSVHLGGDSGALSDPDNSGWVEYKTFILAPIITATLKMRYADDVQGDECNIFWDGSRVASFITVDTGTWNDHVYTSPISIGTIQPGLHTLKIMVTDQKTYGLTVDYLDIEGEALPMQIYLPAVKK